MKHAFLLATVLAFLSLSSGQAQAELRFEKKRVSLAAKPEDETVTATFKFTNNGKLPVTIKKVDSNCGCISAVTDKERYKRKESGTVTAEFKIGSFEGEQNKQVWVVYAEDLPVIKPKVVGSINTEVPEGSVPPPPPVVDDTPPAEPPTETARLAVAITIPSLINIEPKITKWTRGGPTESKTIKVTMMRDEPIHLKKVTSSRDNLTVETKAIEEGKVYEITLTPTTTEKIQLGMLTLMTDCEITKHQKKLAFFSIERPGRTKPAPKPKPAEEPAPDKVAEGDLATTASSTDSPESKDADSPN